MNFQLVMPRCSGLCAQLLNHVWLFATPRTAARRAPLSMGFSRQEHWSGVPLPSPGDLANSGIEQVPFVSPVPLHTCARFHDLLQRPVSVHQSNKNSSQMPGKGSPRREGEPSWVFALLQNTHCLLNSQGRVSESQFADSSSASHLSCWAAFNSVPRTSLPTLQKKKYNE